MFKIDKDVPPQSPGKTGKGVKKYPFHEMEVGDSFLITDPLLYASVRVQASKHSGCGKRFTCAAEDNGVRVHRIA